MEKMYPFTIRVVMPEGQMYSHDVYAHTKWHAVELLYTKLSEHQSDRSMYLPIRKRKAVKS